MDDLNQDIGVGIPTGGYTVAKRRLCKAQLWHNVLYESCNRYTLYLIEIYKNQT